MTEQATFINRLRICHSIDLHELEAAGLRLDGKRWHEFRSNPYVFLMRCDDPTADAIWRVIQARETG
jgi:hypothetical protein